MFFEFSDKTKDLQQRLNAFMDTHIYPNEAEYYRQLNEGDRWKVIPLIEELKREPKPRICGTFSCRKASTGPALQTWSTRRFAKSWAGFPGHRKFSTAPHRTPATWKPWFGTAARNKRRNGSNPCWRATSVRFLYDRTPGGLVGCPQHRSRHRARRRRIRDQRPQMVVVGRRRSALRDLHFHG